MSETKELTLLEKALKAAPKRNDQGKTLMTERDELLEAFLGGRITIPQAMVALGKKPNTIANCLAGTLWTAIRNGRATVVWNKDDK